MGVWWAAPGQSRALESWPQRREPWVTVGRRAGRSSGAESPWRMPRPSRRQRSREMGSGARKERCCRR
eukprot:scaffold16219_cov102-Isochrysis_galbana.AAC.15